MADWLINYWGLATALIDVALAVGTSLHVILHKRDPRAAVTWVGMVWLVPFLGVLLYWVLGVNRIRRRATGLSRKRRADVARASAAARRTAGVPDAVTLETPLPSLVQAVDRIVQRELTPGNHVEPLENGDAVYPAMLSAIDSATRSVALLTYIFDNDAAGTRFVEALARAQARGVSVRVLIDGVGARYSWPPITGVLNRRGIRAATFLPTWIPLSIRFFNLRNHRKILIVDGSTAFTGGINIRHGHVIKENPADPVRDLHFHVTGPVVAQLMECFAEDWAFTTKENLSGDEWHPKLEACGNTQARAITHGPDDDFDVLRHVLLAALASAHHSVRLMTPYFIPDSALITALNVAALRGIRVDVVIPERGNIRLAQWASMALLWQILKRGCRVYLSGPPFDHTKLLIVDETWVLLGSANWDARSLRLNFELNVECYDPKLAKQLSALVENRIATAREIDLAHVDGRSLPIRVRDGLAKLLAPFL